VVFGTSSGVVPVGLCVGVGLGLGLRRGIILFVDFREFFNLSCSMPWLLKRRKTGHKYKHCITKL
jgi:hypothetical protein